MELKKFDTTNTEFRQGKSIIAFNSHGLVSISKGAVKTLGLKIGDRFALLQDQAEERNWFLTHDKNGFKCRSYNGTQGLFFSCSQIAKLIVEIAGKEQSVSCKLITTPVNEGEMVLYPIIVPKPVEK